jgi:hypothetical protein
MTNVIGVPQVIANMQAFQARIEHEVSNAVLETAKDAKSTADPLTPVGKRAYSRAGQMHPGYLRSRNQARMVKNGPTHFVSEYSNDADYALFVAMGHHTRSGTWVAKQDFLTLPYVYGRRRLQERLSALIP